MATYSYRAFYQAFSKRYESELSKQCIQDNCNDCWNNLKNKFSGEKLNSEIDKKIQELQAGTKCTRPGPVQQNLFKFFKKVTAEYLFNFLNVVLVKIS